jgi:hypothetical protein
MDPQSERNTSKRTQQCGDEAWVQRLDFETSAHPEHCSRITDTSPEALESPLSNSRTVKEKIGGKLGTYPEHPEHVC